MDGAAALWEADHQRPKGQGIWCIYKNKYLNNSSVGCARYEGANAVIQGDVRLSSVCDLDIMGGAEFGFLLLGFFQLVS